METVSNSDAQEALGELQAAEPSGDRRPRRIAHAPNPIGPPHVAKVLGGHASIRNRTPEELEAMRRRGGRRGGAATAAGLAELSPEERAERIRKLNEARLTKQRQLRARGESLWDSPTPAVAVLGGKTRIEQQTSGMSDEERSEFFRQRGRAGGKASGQARQPESEEVRQLREATKKLVAEMRALEQAQRDGAPSASTGNDGGCSSGSAPSARKAPARKRRARRQDTSRGQLAISPAELHGQGPTPPVQVPPPVDAVAIEDVRQAQAVVEIRRDLRIKLPSSGRRNDTACFCKLLRSMRPAPASGWDFVGKIFPCGKVVDEKSLRPDSTWPAVPLVLESAGTGASGPLRHGSRRNPSWFVLWRLDGANWTEIARVQASGLEWVKLIAPAVEKELAPPVVGEDMIHAMCFKMLQLFDRWALKQTPENRHLMVQLMHDEIAGRVARW
jgi:hypothetical protein